MHPSRELSYMSNSSTASLVEALNLVGTDIQNSLDNMQKCIEKGLHEVNQSIKEIETLNQCHIFLMADKYMTPSIDDGVECGSTSNKIILLKSDLLVKFQIQQPDGLSTTCRIPPPKDFMSMFGKGKNKYELMSI